MNLNKLSNQNLDANLKTLVAGEREILAEILLHIKEVDRRKLFLDFGFSSLFSYLTESIGYANGSAQRRIDAARLSVDAPEVIEKLGSGELNLAQVSLLQKSIREVQVTSKKKIDSQTKETLVEQLSNKSFAESEVLVAQTFSIQPKEHIKTQYQKDESVRLEITFSKAQWEQLNRMRQLLSHSMPNGSDWNHVLEYVSDKVIQQKDKSQEIPKPNQSGVCKARKKAEATESLVRPRFRVSQSEPIGNPLVRQQSHSNLESFHTANAAQPIKAAVPIIAARKHIPMATQRKVFRRDQCCQYRDKTSGKQCGSRWQLTIDHRHPIWANGTNEIENLRLLCAAHNRAIYRYQANIT